MLSSLINEDFVVKSPFTPVKDRDCDIWQIIQRSITKCPYGIALEDPEECKAITYKELGELVELIASKLYSDGINIEKPVTICMNNCIEYVLVLLSVWRLGGKVTLINPLLSAGEIKKQLENQDSEYIFCNKISVNNVLKSVVGLDIKTLFSKEEHVGCTTISDLYTYKNNLNIPPSIKINASRATAVIAFSSGTTGGPKGVELSHFNILQNSVIFNRCLGMQSSHYRHDSTVIYQPFSHMYGINLIALFLEYRYRVVIMQQFDIEKYISIVSNYKIEKLFLVPPIIIQLCNSDILKRYPLSHVKLVMCGAAPLRKEQEKELLKLLGSHVEICQAYGMTETCGACIMVPVKGMIDNQVQCPRGSVGWPVVNCYVKIIDERGFIQGPNKNGEICVKCNIMTGYYKNQKATAQIIDNDGWLHTGDIGYYDENGCFFIVDRIKELIKYKGYQVAPSELEALLLTHPLIQDAAVTSIPDLECGELPMAWVVKKQLMNVTEQQIHDFVKERAAPFKRLRGGIKFVRSIPKSPSGKILRRILKERTLSSKL